MSEDTEKLRQQLEELDEYPFSTTACLMIIDNKGAAEVRELVQNIEINGITYQLQLLLTSDPNKMFDSNGLQGED